jgi:hypothetical protein
MKTPIYLDIETLKQPPYPWMLRESEDLVPPRTIKDPEKRTAWVADKAATQEAELRDQSSLEPLLGGVVLCVGMAIGDREPRVLSNVTGDEEGERKLLELVERVLCSGPSKATENVDRWTLPIVSWNGQFDWQFLGKRALRHGLWNLARRMVIPRPWGDPLHIDARGPWMRWDSRAIGRQVEVARFLGIEVTDTVNGRDVAQLWEQGDRDAIVDHCLSDVRVLREIVRRFARAGWMPELAVAEAEREPPPIPPARGSVADLLTRSHVLQIQRDPDQVRAALQAATIQVEVPEHTEAQETLRLTLEALPMMTTHQLRAYLLALGGRL